MIKKIIIETTLKNIFKKTSKMTVQMNNKTFIIYKVYVISQSES